MRVRIFQPIVPEYRKALFDGLVDFYGDRIEVWAASRVGVDSSIPLERMRYDYSHKLVNMGPFVWQRGLNLRGLKRGDIVVVCGDVHQLSSLWMAFCAKCRGIGIVWWGHHISALADFRKVAIRLWLAKHLSDVYLCYTDEGVGFLNKHGVSAAFATGNTIDLDAVTHAVESWSEAKLTAFKRDHGLLGKRVLLFCGVLREKVRVDILLESLAKVRESISNLHLVVIGAGERAGIWKELSRKLNLEDCVTWVGELRGQDKLCPWFLSSEIFVYPGRIGLSLIHAFSFGLPVILNDCKENHGPEYVAFHPGENGISFRANDQEDLASKIGQALNDKNFFKRGQAGRDFVFRNYSMKRMVERYAEAIEAAKIYRQACE